jgi:hypothetical protein
LKGGRSNSTRPLTVTDPDGGGVEESPSSPPPPQPTSTVAKSATAADALIKILGARLVVVCMRCNRSFSGRGRYHRAALGEIDGINNRLGIETSDP